jgi:hypothetical protein
LCLSPSVAPLDHAVMLIFDQTFFKKVCDKTFSQKVFGQTSRKKFMFITPGKFSG